MLRMPLRMRIILQDIMIKNNETLLKLLANL